MGILAYDSLEKLGPLLLAALQLDLADQLEEEDARKQGAIFVTLSYIGGNKLEDVRIGFL